MSSRINRAPSASAGPRPTLRYGDRIGSYVITGFAGQGATSFVYKARREDSFEPLAVKVLHPHLLQDELKRRRFLREAEMMIRMRHNNIVCFHEIMELGDQLAFVMEYIEGQTLEEWQLDPKWALDEATLACLFVDLLRGLGHAHRHGIVHRDLKPANVMITFEEGRHVAKIIDFGVARFADRPVAADEKKKIVGTAAYISPEEVRDPESVCPASDIYSVGVMMYEASCGRRPFEGMGVRELMQAHVDETPASPRVHNPGLTPEFEGVILRAISKSPEGRFNSARELIMALEGAIHAAMIQSTEVDEMATTEWARVGSLPKELDPSVNFLLYVRQYLLFAMTFLMTTGVRGDHSDPHHLNRDIGGVPFQ